MTAENNSPLASVEPRLRYLLPARVYAEAWVDPSSERLNHVFEHLRTLQRILYDYIPRQVAEDMLKPDREPYAWQEGALMFTDLSGFTSLVEANAKLGKAGADTLLGVLNGYFAAMIEVLSKSGGNLLEFTGDAMLIEFPVDPSGRINATAQAVRAGLRMQRAMQSFAEVKTEQDTFALAQRVGIHYGRFLTADIGTPRHKKHVLLGSDVHTAKLAEGDGFKGRVNLTMRAHEQVADEDFRFEPGEQGYMLVVDDLSDEKLGEFEITARRQRRASAVLLDRSVEGLVSEIEGLVAQIEPLASFLPGSILNLLIETAGERGIPPDFPTPTIIFVNMVGLPEAVDRAQRDEEHAIVAHFSRLFSHIDAAVVSRSGVVQRVTYHHAGSDMLIFFGVPTSHQDDAHRAAEAALAIRSVIAAGNENPPTAGGEPIQITSQIGMARGEAFAAEIGELRGRREFNIHGDAVNTAARLMSRAVGNRILMTEPVKEAIGDSFDCQSLGAIPLKGKSERLRIYELRGSLDEQEDEQEDEQPEEDSPS